MPAACERPALRPVGPTLARAFRARDFRRPNFTTATYRMAAESHNLLRGADIDPYASNLSRRNLAVPHRFSWKSIRDNTLLYLNGDEDESAFRRWTDRMVYDGYDGKRRQFRGLQAWLKHKRDKRLTKYGGPDQLTERLDDQIAACRRILMHMSRSQNDLRDARRSLIAQVESGASRRRVLAAATLFFKLMNNFFPNVPDLGPHRGVNIQVRERMHLNVDVSGSMSPFSSQMVAMSPHRSEGIAVDDDGWVVGTFGDVVDPGRLDSDLAAGIHSHGTFIVNNRDEPFTWQ